MAIVAQPLILIIESASVPVTDFLETQWPRVQHIMQEKHAWDLTVSITRDWLQYYRTIQLYIT
jgi:hypothetical protein